MAIIFIVEFLIFKESTKFITSCIVFELTNILIISCTIFMGDLSFFNSFKISLIDKEKFKLYISFILLNNSFLYTPLFNNQIAPQYTLDANFASLELYITDKHLLT